MRLLRELSTRARRRSFDRREPINSRREERRKTEEIKRLMATSAETLAAVRNLNSKADSMILFLGDLKSQLAEALSGMKVPPDVQADIDAIFTEADEQAAEVVAAIGANTPTQPEPEPEPVQ